MKFRCERDDLLEAVQFASRAISTRATLPVLVRSADRSDRGRPGAWWQRPTSSSRWKRRSKAGVDEPGQGDRSRPVVRRDDSQSWSRTGSVLRRRRRDRDRLGPRSVPRQSTGPRRLPVSSDRGPRRRADDLGVTIDVDRRCWPALCRRWFERVDGREPPDPDRRSVGDRVRQRHACRNGLVPARRSGPRRGRGAARVAARSCFRRARLAELARALQGASGAVTAIVKENLMSFTISSGGERSGVGGVRDRHALHRRRVPELPAADPAGLPEHADRRPRGAARGHEARGSARAEQPAGEAPVWGTSSRSLPTRRTSARDRRSSTRSTRASLRDRVQPAVPLRRRVRDRSRSVSCSSRRRPEAGDPPGRERRRRSPTC